MILSRIPKTFIVPVCLIVLGTLNSVYPQVLGHTLPDPLPPPLTDDVTIDGAVFCGGLSGNAVLNLGDDDTLFVVGEADLTEISFSDPTAGTVVFVYRVDSVNVMDSVVFGSLELNNMDFVAVASGNGEITLKLVGDYLEANGSITRHYSQRWRHTQFGSKERKLNIVVRGDMLMEHFSNEDPLATGWPGTARNRFYADSLVFYGDVVLHTWYTYNGMGDATLRFAGNDLQNVGLGAILKVERYERNGVRTKDRSRNLATIIHDGTGTMQLYGAPISCEKFVQSGGPLSLNGSAFGVDTLEFTGRLISDVPWSEDSAGGEIVVYEKASFLGTPTDSVQLNTTESWVLRSFGAVIADHAVIGNSTIEDENATGIAFHSRNAGNTVRWDFMSDDAVLFSLNLPETLTVNTVEPITLNVATVSSPSMSQAVTYRWTVDGTVFDDAGGTTLIYTDSAAVSDNGKVVRVYALVGGSVIDSSGPTQIQVVDSPRIDKVAGRKYCLYGDVVDTVSVYAELIAGVDSLHWFTVEGENESLVFSALSVTTDTLDLALDSTFLGGKRLAVVGFDTDANPFAPDTEFVKVSADEIRVAFARGIDTVADGETITYEMGVSKWTGSDSLTYRWFKDDEEVENETSVLSIDSIVTADIGRYVGEIGVRHRKENVTAVDTRLTLYSAEAGKAGDMPGRFSFRMLHQSGGPGIRVAVPIKTAISVTILDMLGRTRAQVGGIYESGYHVVDLSTTKQNRWASGGYILRVEADGKTYSRRVFLQH